MSAAREVAKPIGTSLAELIRASGIPKVSRKQAGQTTVLTKTPQNHKKALAKQGPSTEDISAFHIRYITLTGLADLVGDTWQSLWPQLKKLGATKLSRDGEDFRLIFAWPEIEAKFLCRWPREHGGQ